MQYRPLGDTGINVSLICLGTMTWGEQNRESEAHDQLNLALEHGINFIDAAEIYPVPTRAETYGKTEEILGNWLSKWLKSGNSRDQLVLATKVASRSDWLPWVRGGQAHPTREQIHAAIDASLKRLRTDYVDLYQIHWPDRKTNYFGELGYTHDPDDESVPIAESLAAMGELVQAGKVRHVGLSNETPWGIMTFLREAERAGLPRVVSVQNPYSLLNRTFEVGNSEVAIREKTGLLAYSPLAFGALSGKYLRVPPTGSRLSLKAFSGFTRYTGPKGRAATERYVNIAREHGLDPAQMALAWVNSRPFTTSTIVGATTLEQLQGNIASADLTLNDAVLQAIEAVHEDLPSPCP